MVGVSIWDHTKLETVNAQASWKKFLPGSMAQSSWLLNQAAHTMIANDESNPY